MSGTVPSGRGKMSAKVYLLWFVPVGNQDENEGDDGLLIGVYESESLAKAAIERLRVKPGFTDYPEGFHIHSRELNQDSWTQGFIRD